VQLDSKIKGMTNVKETQCRVIPGNHHALSALCKTQLFPFEEDADEAYCFLLQETVFV
jgi:hypothetical protein